MAIFDFIKSIFSRRTINKAKADSKKQDDLKIDEKILIDYYRTDPVIKRAINTITNKIFSDGYNLIGSEAQKNQAEEFIKDSEFYLNLKDAVRMALITGNAYQEVNVETRKVYNLNPWEIEIELDKTTGEVSSYIQKIDGRIVAKIDPEKIIHYKFETLGDNKYGIGLVEPILFISAIKRFVERNFGKRFEKEKLRGFWLFKNVSEEEFEAMTNLISECKDDPQRDIYLKGGKDAEVIYQNLISGEDMQFKNLTEYIIQQQITGLMIHPLHIGIPKGSNKTTAEEENEDFNDFIASVQYSIEQILNKRLFKDMLNLNVEIELLSINKRDTLTEIQIASGLNNLPTSINEVREELGLPLINEPWADEIRNVKSEQSLFENDETENIEEETEEELEKSLKEEEDGENFPRESAVTEKDENRFFIILKKYINSVGKDLIELIKTDKQFRKQLNDPDIYVDRVISRNDIYKFKRDIDKALKEAFLKGHNKAQKEVGRNLAVNSEKLDFLSTYTFDLINGLTEDMKNKLKQILRRGLIENRDLSFISKEISKALEVSLNRAKTIARTETNRIANNGRLEAYISGGVEKIKWVSSIDNRTTDICRELNGQVVKIGENFKLKNGEEISSPPAHINCRSTIVPVFD